MVFHISWSTKAHGARNLFQGEYDSALYFMLVVGVPVFWSCRACIHVIDVNKIRSKERLQRLRDFAAKHLGSRWPGGEIQFSLRRNASLRRLIWYEWGLVFCVIMAFAAALAVWGISGRRFNRWTRHDLMFAVPLSVLGFLSVPAGIAYFLARKPSHRQKRIRSVVAERLGPFSDPADWTPELIASVALDMGISPPEPARLLQAAEQRMKSKSYGEAVALARMGLSIADIPGADDIWTEEKPRAESLTDEALLHLGDAAEAGIL
jgi:hypothetical protein